MSPLVIEATTQARWQRGPAHLRGDLVGLDFSKLTFYDPIVRRNLPYDMAGIGNPLDAVAFAEEYGLLAYRDHQHEKIHEQPFEEFDRAARWLQGLIAVNEDLNAAVAGDRGATERLRRWAIDAPHPSSYHWRTYLDPEEFELAESRYLSATTLQWRPSGNHQEFLRSVGLWYTKAISDTKGTASLITYLPEDAAPNGFQRGVAHNGRSLVEIAAFMLDQDILDKVKLARCAAWPRCTAYVRENDGRGRKAKWHSKECGARNRKRRQRAGGR